MAETVAALPTGFEVVPRRDVVPPPPGFEAVPIRREAPMTSGALKQHFQTQARGAKTFDDFIDAGFQGSITGLIKRGAAPEVALDQDSPWYGRMTAGAVGLAGDLPAMLGGAILTTAGTGGRGGPVIAAGGAFALPAGLRAVLMDAYTNGEVTSAGDFVGRLLHSVKETGKGWLTGIATGGAGVAARAVLPAGSSLVVRATVPTAAELTTMVTVGNALEGRLPEPHEFLDAAFLIGGLKASVSTASRLRTIYAKTGIPPQQVMADAARDPVLKAELVAETVEVRPETGQLELPGIPKAYQVAAQAETARAIVPGEKAGQVAASPFALELPQAVGEPARPTHVNYNYITNAMDTKLAMARLSEVYEKEIQTQRRGTVSWEQTSAEAGKALSDALGGVDTKLIMPREPGTAAGAAEILARKQMVVGAAEAMMGARDALLEKGARATMEDQLHFIASVERTAMIQSEFLGARAEAGRALNILKSTVMDAERIKAIQNVIDIYGKDPIKLAEMMRELDNPAAALKFAREAVKATTWEKMIEAWKAGLLSGPITHMRNILGNTSFMVSRPFIDLTAAGFGLIRSGPDRVTLVEPLARVVGNIQGTLDAARLAAVTFRLGERDHGKVEIYRQANEGAVGSVVQVPFRFLQSADTFFRTLNERGEAYTLAVRKAAAEGLNPATREFQERVAAIVQNPDAVMLAEMKAAGERFTFNKPFEHGGAGQLFQSIVRKTHTEFLFPFVRTPARILEETVRLTPFAPFIKSWRQDLMAGGAKADKAMAEIGTGAAFMSYMFALALDGTITGAGNPDAGKRAIDVAAGKQPYSWKIDGEYYSYQGWGPLTTLIGMAADAATVWDHTTDEEADKIPKILAVAFANAVTNQTALMGMTNLVNVTSDPTRYGPTFFKGLAGSLVPSLINQVADWLDPVQREVYGTIDAIKKRIPGLRETLFPKRDPFGETVETKERLLGATPITITKESTDKVRAEASRLGVSAPATPRKTHLGRGSGKIGDVELEPEERDRFSEIGGKLAHSILEQMVNAPNWDEIPDLVKKNIYRKVFTQARKAAAAQALPLEKRLGLLMEITEKVQAELTPAPQ